ncbi:Anucleate primary sterigmata protein A [Escovopsis weberi]|uniref:Anucleate primary sterigmata protein A n=1 Tax=Escovopsis weberi TaxID=150374 RepID=A0A0M8N8Q9_ESCWE|nr:Anucleate primary sterigmata protein A [Escovopsis weberi]
MASSVASSSSDRPDGSITPADDSNNDPFISTGPATTTSNDNKDNINNNSNGPSHLRFSTFDQELFAAGPGSSPRQAKRALEAHLAETDRRLAEAGKLGTALVGQRKALAEQLNEIEKLQAEAELNPELRQKLVDIEKEYNDLARESARVFLPKQRPISTDTTISAPPYTLEGRSGRRSASPSKFESSGSPTKLSVPSRKMRNQASSRVHDIEFAAEISTSLIAQVRNLQALLGERDEQVKDLRNDAAKMEQESEAFQQRLRILDESEHRYKEENWDLQTRLQEVAAQQREAADREKKLNQALSTANTAKTAAQKELDEVKLSHAKLTEEHAAATKHHDIELGIAKRTIANVESERAQLQRKVDELTSQNQELVKAISSQRMRSQERDEDLLGSQETFEMLDDEVTPEHSPPVSPIKFTPRHSGLEAETIKTSLQHAQRTIQSQRSQLHREKTEKIELKRIIQDLRDDLEKTRNDITGGGTSAPLPRRGRKSDAKEPIKKPPRLLGTFRSSRQEIISDDPEWEDTHDLVPRAASFGTESLHSERAQRSPVRSSLESFASGGFETANEANESGFESAHEGPTEAGGMRSAGDGFSDTDGALTETEETPTRGFGAAGPAPSLPPKFARHGHSRSLDSTASISTDDDAYPLQLRTPSQRPRHRRLSKGALTNPRQTSMEFYASSPAASFVSNNQSSAAATPQTGPGQSLFAELQDFGSDDDSVGYTPGRRSARSVTPGSITRRVLEPPPPLPGMPRLLMVDSGMMTDPVEFAAVDGIKTRPFGPSAAFLDAGADETRRPKSMESVVHDNDIDFRPSPTGSPRTEEEDEEVASSRTASTISYSDAGAQYEEFDQKLGQFIPQPAVEPRALSLSPIQSEDVQPLEPKEEAPSPPPALSMAPILTQHDVEPIAEPEPTLPTLSISPIAAESLEPVSEPEAIPAPLSMSGIVSTGVEPIEEPALPLPALTLSSILVEDLEPREEPPSPLPPLTLSTILSEGLEPISEPSTPSPSLCLSPIFAEHLEPRAEPAAPRPALSLSGIFGEHWEPKAEAPIPPPTLSMIPIRSEVVDPIASPSSPPARTERDILPVLPAQLPKLCLSSVVAEHVEPVVEPEVVISPPSLRLSPLQCEDLPPVEGAFEETLKPTLVLSNIAAENVQPVPEPKPLPPAFAFSSLRMEHTSPIEELSPATPTFVFSPVAAEAVEPVSTPVEVAPVSAPFAFSPIESIETRPITPRSPKRDGFIIPRSIDSPFSDEPSSAQSMDTVFADFLNHRESKDGIASVIAADNARQIASDSAKEGQRPLSANSDARSAHRYRAQTNDQGAQTALTASTIEWLMGGGAGTQNGLVRGKDAIVAVGGSQTIEAAPAAAHPQDGNGLEGLAPGYHKGKSSLDASSEYGAGWRPSTAISVVSVTYDEAPALVPSHMQTAPAVRASSSGGPQAPGAMGPPLFPASAMKGRPQSPTSQHHAAPSASGRATPTYRSVRAASSHSNTDFHLSPVKPPAVSRQSSSSSFVSELDVRFNMRGSELGGVDPPGFSPNTDPRMIQAITQTMIGEFLWKYTRKAGRGELSEKRHRRYFWVHPYTRTIYWSDRDPSTAGRTELRAKSLPIEAVRVVTDDNVMPPGLYRKSLVIISPGRTIKFTCATGQRHETWFNALSYLLLRTTQVPQTHSDTEDMVDGLTREDIDEFNPSTLVRPGMNSTRLMAPSISSRTSRMTRQESQADRISFDIPTLTPSSKQAAGAGKSGMSLGSKLGGYLRAGAPRHRSRTSFQSMINETSEAHDSAEDLREMIERQDREADRLENVRQCCDGKHDVGTLPHAKRRSANIQLASHPGPSPVPGTSSGSTYAVGSDQLTVTTPTTSTRPRP